MVNFSKKLNVCVFPYLLIGYDATFKKSEFYRLNYDNVEFALIYYVS